MDTKFSSLVDKALQKYGLPTWVKPYVSEYVRGNPLNAIKHATSFIEIRRKKGEITRDYVRLPNGLTFKISFVEEVLSLFHYGEERVNEIYERWSKEPGYDNLERKKRFAELAQLSKKHLRAIKNLMEGIGIQQKQPRKDVIDLFDYIESLNDWDDRVIVSGIFLRYSFSYPFGFVFYKVFYPVAPEFMRSFGKAFTVKTDATGWLDAESRHIAYEHRESEHLMKLSEELLRRIYASISSEESTAKSSGIAGEIKLLRDISVAYPLHVLNELGAPIDVDKEVKSITRKRAG